MDSLFLLPILHLFAAWLHYLPASKIFKRRGESRLFRYFWLNMMGSAVFHLGVALKYLGIELSYAPVIPLANLSHKSALALLTVTLIPLFIAELRVLPEKTNRGAEFLRQVFVLHRWLFVAATGFALSLIVAYGYVFCFGGSQVPLVLARLYNGGQLWFIITMGGLWACLLLSGLRPRNNENIYTKRPFHIVFGIMLLIAIPPSFMPDSALRSFLFRLGPLTSVPFALMFAWYRFRMTLLDVVLKQGLRWLLLALAALVVVKALPDELDTNFHQAWALLLILLLMAVADRAGILEKLIQRLWRPAQPFRDDFIDRFNQHLVEQKDEAETLKGAGEFLSQTFEAQIEVSTQVLQGNHIMELPGSPHLYLSIGPVKGMYPWYDDSLARLRQAGFFVRGHLRLLAELSARNRAAIAQEQMAREKMTAELAAMRAQIQPHFLFNTLNTIHSFVHDNPGAAEETIEQLADLMRGILSSSERDTIPLHEELAVVRAYLNIERARFGERLHWEIVADHCPPHRQIPALSLQPLVENAVKHGTSDGAVNIVIEYQERDDTFELQVRDDGPGVGEEHHAGLGMALKNIRTRLTHLHGHRAGLELSSLPQGGTMARLFLPLEEET